MYPAMFPSKLFEIIRKPKSIPWSKQKFSGLKAWLFPGSFLVVKTMKVILFGFLISTVCYVFPTQLPPQNPIRFGLIYSGIGSANWPGGFVAKISAELAIEKIREAKHLGLEPAETADLELVPFNTQCDADLAEDILFPILAQDEVKFFIGPGCSIETKSVVSFVAHSFFNESVYQKPFLLASSYFYKPLDKEETTLIR